jgi:hypothetical protein
MPKFTLIEYTSVKGHIASIHRTGCKDIDRDALEHGGVNIEYDGYDTAEDVRNDWLDAEMRELGYGDADVKILKCAKPSRGLGR